MLKRLLAWMTRKKAIAQVKLALNPASNKQMVNIKQQSVFDAGPISYMINDPSTPELVMRADQVKPELLEINVKGFAGAGHKSGTLEAQAAQCYMCIVKQINYLQKFAKSPIKKWTAVKSLLVDPRAGKDFNAFYNRQGLKFFFSQDPVTKKIIYTSESCDVVIHELGHAILDCLRPDLWNTQSLEVWAFHEAFGDCCALLHSMQYDQLINLAIQQTGCDLKKSNIISALAEEMGIAIFHATKDNSMLKYALRDAANNFKYVEPEKLPEDTPDNKLSRECHNFSRIWTGAFYEIIIKIAETEAKNSSLKSGVEKARDVMAKYLLSAVAQVPLNIRLFDALAKQIIKIDADNGSPYHSILVNVFTNRGIMRQTIRMLTNQTKDDIVSLSLAANETVEDNGNSLRVTKIGIMKLSEEIDPNQISALAFNPLFDLEIEVAAETGYIFDSNGQIIDIISSSKEDIVHAATVCLNELHRKSQVGPDGDTSFEEVDGKLIRSHFKCGCGSGYGVCGVGSGVNNSKNPSAPEYNKGWKKENNAGCCQGNCKSNCGTPSDIVVIRSTITR